MARTRRAVLGVARIAVASCGLLGSAPARAGAPVSVWFRSTDGCPTGDEFLARLAEHAVLGRIAGVGDRIDFVVTLGKKGDESSAVLERQSSQGTVALRELHGPRCEAVAEAVALTLALTVDPDATPQSPENEPQQSTSPHAPPSASTASAATTTGPPPDAPAAPAGAPAATSARNGEARTRWLAGVQGTVGAVMSGASLWGGAAFVELHATTGWRSAGRVSLFGGVASDPIPNVKTSLFGARLEACPLFVGSSVAAGACAAFELGQLGASSRATGGRSDATTWAALWAIARLRYLPPGSALGAELQGGITAPLTRYRITGESPPRTLGEVRTVGVGLAAGIGVGWP